MPATVFFGDELFDDLSDFGMIVFGDGGFLGVVLVGWVSRNPVLFQISVFVPIQAIFIQR